MILFRPQAKYDKDANCNTFNSRQTHARFKKELEKGEIYPVLEG